MVSAAVEVDATTPSPTETPSDLGNVPLLNDTEIWIRRHPASGLGSGYASTDDTPCVDLSKLKFSLPIYFSFNTYTNFLQAEVFSTNNVSDQLALKVTNTRI